MIIDGDGARISDHLLGQGCVRVPAMAVAVALTSALHEGCGRR